VEELNFPATIKSLKYKTTQGNHLVLQSAFGAAFFQTPEGLWLPILTTLCFSKILELSFLKSTKCVLAWQQ